MKNWLRTSLGSYESEPRQWTAVALISAYGALNVILFPQIKRNKQKRSRRQLRRQAAMPVYLASCTCFLDCCTCTTAFFLFQEITEKVPMPNTPIVQTKPLNLSKCAFLHHQASRQLRKSLLLKLPRSIVEGKQCATTGHVKGRTVALTNNQMFILWSSKNVLSLRAIFPHVMNQASLLCMLLKISTLVWLEEVK